MLFGISVKNWSIFMYHIAEAIFNADQCNLTASQSVVEEMKHARQMPSKALSGTKFDARQICQAKLLVAPSLMPVKHVKQSSQLAPSLMPSKHARQKS